MTAAATPLQACSVLEAPAWLVGGAVRDRLLRRETSDFDVVVAGDPEQAARTVARGARGHAFELSERFGAWRVIARDRSWQVDVMALEGATIEQDLAHRDLTINAIAEPVAAAGEAPVDPFGGVSDLRASRLRMVAGDAFGADPLRVLRLARLACELGFEIEPATATAARAVAPALATVSPERTFAELRRLLCSPQPVRGVELLSSLGIAAAVLPELEALDGVQQSRFHHLDVLGHTRQVLGETVKLVDDPSWLCTSDEGTRALQEWLSAPLANELTRGQALRFGALLHDIAKPRTRAVTDEGRVTFMGHDRAGAELGTVILRRLRASEKLCAHVAALTLHHLRLGFLVHRMPLPRRDVYDYLLQCAPVGVDVTLLSVADRLATRGSGSDRAIARHAELARQMVAEALRWEAHPPRPPVRGDELARALGIRPGPQLGGLLAELQAEAFSGELATPEQAIDRARELVAARDQ
jgi:putative nucleotidyltransferase with HDIG domain